jgi:protein SCO1/2
VTAARRPDVTFKVVLATRLRLAVTVATLCAAAIVAIALAAPGDGAGRGAATPAKTGRFYGATVAPGFPAVDFALRDQNDQLIRLRDYAGQVVALTFIDSTCANTCPDIVAQLTAAIDELPHPISALAISVDPKQDTATNVKSFLLKQQALAQLHYLVAKRSVLEPIWKRFSITPQRKIKSARGDFSVALLLIDKTGRARVRYSGLAALNNPDVIAADIRTLQAQPMARPAPRRVTL